VDGRQVDTERIDERREVYGPAEAGRAAIAVSVPAASVAAAASASIRTRCQIDVFV
jgi:hypothetical protein